MAAIIWTQEPWVLEAHGKNISRPYALIVTYIFENSNRQALPYLRYVDVDTNQEKKNMHEKPSRPRHRGWVPWTPTNVKLQC